MHRVQTDVEVRFERFGHVLTEHLSDASTPRSTNDLAHQKAVGDRVVSVLGARLPPGLLFRKCVTHGRPVEECLSRQGFSDRRQSALMREQPANGNVLLSGSAELRPVLDDRRVEIEKPLLDQSMGANRGHALGRRVGIDERVAFPFAVAVRALSGSDEPAPEIDDGFPVEREGDRSTDLSARFEFIDKDLTHLFEARITMSMDGDCHFDSPFDSAE